jgi:hypothetical protein
MYPFFYTQTEVGYELPDCTASQPIRQLSSELNLLLDTDRQSRSATALCHRQRQCHWTQTGSPGAQLHCVSQRQCHWTQAVQERNCTVSVSDSATGQTDSPGAQLHCGSQRQCNWTDRQSSSATALCQSASVTGQTGSPGAQLHCVTVSHSAAVLPKYRS